MVAPLDAHHTESRFYRTDVSKIRYKIRKVLHIPTPGATVDVEQVDNTVHAEQAPKR